MRDMSNHIYPLRIGRGNENRSPLFTLYRSIIHPNVRDAVPRNRLPPQRVDLRSKMPPVYDQGDLDSCTANAICAVVQYDDPALQASRMFLYYNERVIEGNTREDLGTTIADGIASLTTFGLCPETDWPYDVLLRDIYPSNECYAVAIDAISSNLRIYSLPNSITDMKKTLVAGFPIIVGIKVYESFESHAVSCSGMVPVPGPSEKCFGGHTVVCVGYNDTTSRWILRNSRGPQWGDAGYFHLPYRYLLDPNLASPLWVITHCASA